MSELLLCYIKIKLYMENVLCLHIFVVENHQDNRLVIPTVLIFKFEPWEILGNIIIFQIILHANLPMICNKKKDTCIVDKPQLRRLVGLQ